MLAEVHEALMGRQMQLPMLKTQMCTDSIKLFRTLHFTQHGQEKRHTRNMLVSEIEQRACISSRKMRSSWPGPKHETTGNPTMRRAAVIH